MKILFALSVLIISVNNVNAQVHVSFNYSNADSTIAILKKKTVSESEVNAFIKTTGTQSIIRKIHSNDSLARTTITKLIAGKPLNGKEYDFQYHLIKNNLATMEDFINTIRNNQQAITDSLKAFDAYLPKDKRLNVTVYFLLGGYSSGFTFSDAGSFYVGAHQYKNDFKSIVNTCQHEIFHNIQNLYGGSTAVMIRMEKEKDLPALYAYYIARNFYVEGTAEYIADLDKADPNSPNIKEYREHAAVNKYRMEDNFYLAERLILDAYADPEKSDPGKIYSILFDWNWNNPGYAMGKWMMQCLAGAYGATSIKKYLAADPMHFLKDYIQLAKGNPSKYPYNFSEQFEKMIDAVLVKVSKN